MESFQKKWSHGLEDGATESRMELRTRVWGHGVEAWATDERMGPRTRGWGPGLEYGAGCVIKSRLWDEGQAA